MKKEELEQYMHAMAWHLYEAFFTDATNFTPQLFRLMRKSDQENLSRLAQGFPDHVAMYVTYMNTPAPEEFFYRMGLTEAEMIARVWRGELVQ